MIPQMKEHFNSSIFHVDCRSGACIVFELRVSGKVGLKKGMFSFCITLYFVIT